MADRSGLDLGCWYLVHTLPRAEMKAVMHLERQGFGVYLPRYLALRSHARRRDWVERPLFPSYLFIVLDLRRDRWRAVNSTVGVRRLVCAGDEPLAVPTAVIEEIRGREDDRGYVLLSAGRTYHQGDRVRFTEGPFLDMAGIFESRNDEERVVVLLSLMGRPTRVTVPLRVIAPEA